VSEHIREHLSRTDPVMAGLVAAVGAYTLVPATTMPPFRALARAITAQQLNGTAAQTIFDRFVGLYAPAAFPSPEAVLATPMARLRGTGLSRGKIASLQDLAAKVLDGTVPTLEALRGLDDAAIIERVTVVRGIGRWTVEMMLMFQLGRADVLPVGDFGVRAGFRLAYGLRAMPDPGALAAYGEIWRPHRTAAAWYLWRAVELSRAGSLPQPCVRVRLPRVRRKARRKAARRAARIKRARQPRARK
jgi:DNA-3-methyladenine glycosylase II